MDFIERLRDTRPFAGPKELMEQLQKDAAEARRLILIEQELRRHVQEVEYIEAVP